jgi:pimeloyl-ACP methyl ester carboxylesterase
MATSSALKSPALSGMVRKVVSFPYLEFKRNNAPIIVLLAGFPDNVTSGWDTGFLEMLKSKYHVITLCLPDYDQKRETISWGANFDELVYGFNQTLNSVIESKNFYLVAHDWGSVVAQMYENKYSERVKKLVLLDVGRGIDPSARGKMVAIYYQLAFESHYFLFKTLGYTIGNLCFKLFSKFTPRFLWPVPYDKMHRPADEMSVHLCYPYYYLWSSVFRLKPIRISFPKCPVLFLYGTKKNCLFHDDHFLKKLDATAGCRHLSLECGHWVTHFEPKVCFSEIVNFCAE